MSRRRVMDGPRRLGKEKLQHALRYAGSEAPRKGRQGYLGGIKSHIEALEKELADVQADLRQRAKQIEWLGKALGMKGEWSGLDLFEEAQRHHEAVARLPKTADGVIIEPEMEVYHPGGASFRPIPLVSVHPNVAEMYANCRKEWYSTKAAAEAAKEGETL